MAVRKLRKTGVFQMVLDQGVAEVDQVDSLYGYVVGNRYEDVGLVIALFQHHESSCYWGYAKKDDNTLWCFEIIT